MSLPNTESPTAEDLIDQARAPVSINKRFLGWCLYLVILCGAFALPLSAFVTYARHSDVHSYVLLIPFVSAYLIYIRWKQLSRELSSAWGYALLLAAIGAGALCGGFALPRKQMGVLCHVPALFPCLHDPIAGGRGRFFGKRLQGSFS